MKKLQLLALSMLLSTPFAVTYTAEQAETAAPAEQNDSNVGRMDDRADRRDDRQASFKAQQETRHDKLEAKALEIKNAYAKFSDSDDTVEAKKDAAQAVVEQQLAEIKSQLVAAHSQLSDVKLSDDQKAALKAAVANLKDEMSCLVQKLQNRHDDLTNRLSHLKQCKDTKTTCLKESQDKLNAINAKLDSKSETMPGDLKATPLHPSRISFLQGQKESLTTKIAAKQEMIKAVNTKIVDAQTKKDVLKAKLADIKTSFVEHVTAAVSSAASSVAKSVGLSK